MTTTALEPTTRKPISKRLRTEVMTRDDFRCRHCGFGREDKVKLTIDHVIPVTLGGSDDSTNLQTLCADCNSGKSSVQPGSPQVAAVAADALRWADAMVQAAAEIESDQDLLHAERVEFITVWNNWGYGEGDNRKTIPLSDDWHSTVDNWIKAGISVEDLVEWIPKSMQRTQVANTEKWRYFCGIAWAKLTERQQRAREILAAADAPELPLVSVWTVNWTDLTVTLSDNKGWSVDEPWALSQWFQRFESINVARFSCPMVPWLAIRSTLYEFDE